MATNHPDYVTGAELTRWMQEQADFRQRLEVRIGIQHSELVGTLRRIEDQVRETNGKTQKNTETIAVLVRDVEAMKSEENHIESLVESIRDDGCSQFTAHQEVMAQSSALAVEAWSAKKKAGLAAGLLAGGSLMWPAIQKIAEAVHAYIIRLPHA